MQPAEQRKYWANRRKAEGRNRNNFPKLKPVPKPATETVLIASDAREYDQLRRDNPGLKVVLQLEQPVQGQLFDTREFRDV